MRRIITGTALFILSAAVWAQTAGSPEFEVASVKPSPPQDLRGMRIMMRGGPGTPDPGQLTYSNVTLKNIVVNAYGVKNYQISAPGWLDSERFDITAKIPTGATKEQFKLMLQNLLAERFKLTLHHESKELPSYELVVAKSGVKMKPAVIDPAAADGPPPPPPGGRGQISIGKDGMPQLPPGAGPMAMMSIQNGRFRMTAKQQAASNIADMLGGQLGRPVIDKTGLTAKYDFTLEFSPEGLVSPLGGPLPPAPPGADGAPAPSAADSDAPSLFSAVQDQLGLRLDQKKGPVDVLIIDHVEKVPTDN